VAGKALFLQQNRALAPVQPLNRHGRASAEREDPAIHVFRCSEKKDADAT
jgi:hypothetical protein